MYTLRIVFYDKTESNINLGNFYRVINSDCESFKEMKEELVKDLEEDDILRTTLYKFVVASDNIKYPLTVSNNNYIVSENGSTFAKL